MVDKYIPIDEAYVILRHGLVEAPSEHDWCVSFEMAIESLKSWQKVKEEILAYGPEQFIKRSKVLDLIDKSIRDIEYEDSPEN